MAEILADLDSLTETEVEQYNKRFLLRSARRRVRIAEIHSRRRRQARNGPGRLSQR